MRALLDIKQRHDAEYVCKLSRQAVHENPSDDSSGSYSVLKYAIFILVEVCVWGGGGNHA